MKFNKQATDYSDEKTKNLAGGDAYSISPKLELVNHLLTSFVQDKFYQSEEDGINRIKELIQAVDHKFAAKAAVYARREFGMRSVSHVVAGELCKESKESWMKDFLQAVVYRPDDITEITSYYKSIQDNKDSFSVTNQMKKGFGAALSSFDHYRLAKYRGDSRKIKLVDCVRMYHPMATPALRKLVKGELTNTQTWESKVSAAGPKKEAKKEAWADLIKEKKLGYLAMVRNIRNIVETCPDMLPRCEEYLTNEKAIKKSLVFPFTFLSALEAIKDRNDVHGRKAIEILSKALELSMANVPEFSGKTLIALDDSGSMTGNNFWGEEIKANAPISIGSIFAAALYKKNDADLFMFSSNVLTPNLMHTDSVISLANQMKSNLRGSGTNFACVFETAAKKYDRVIMLSDMQGWGYRVEDSLKAYKSRTKSNPKLYTMDLSGHSSSMFPEKNIYCISGFSEKIFDTMKLLEQDKQALVNTIENLDFTPIKH